MIHAVAVYCAFLVYDAITIWTPLSLQIQLLSLDKLPFELILKILQYVSFEDKLSLSLVNKYLNHVVNISMYQTIYVVDKGFRCLNNRLTCCYDFDKLNPIYLNYVECIHQTNNKVDAINHELVPYALILNHVDLQINMRNDYVASKLSFLEIDQNYKIPPLNNLKVLKVHKDVDISCCFSTDDSLDRLEELIIVDNPLVLKRFSVRLPNITKLQISINVEKLNYEDFWDCLQSKISISSLQVFKISFDSSLNLNKNPYLISIESLQYLDEINNFLQKFANSTTSCIRQIHIIVKDQRQGCNNFYKKIQPDLNQFLTLLPYSLKKVEVKLSNEFNLGQFNGFLSKHLELQEFSFVGNLNSDFLNGSDLKLNMLNHGCVIKDYTMYGKFNRVSDNDVGLIDEFANLSKRCDGDFLNDDILINKIDSLHVKDMIMKHLSGNGIYANLQKVILNGLVFQIESNQFICISDA